MKALLNFHSPPGSASLGRAGLLLLGALALQSCRKEPVEPVPTGPTPLAIPIPSNFPPMPIPEDNPTTVEGVALGRKLFYEKRLSGDNTQSCASCHSQAFAFTDNGRAFSTGIDGIEGPISAMAVINIGWVPELFWDGRALGVEAQAAMPVENPIEMHTTWANVVAKLSADAGYRAAFKAAFGTEEVTQDRATKAIAQFERTMISAGSPYDRYQRGDTNALSAEAKRGMALFFTERADCFHCHTVDLMTDNDYHNNGIDQVLHAGNMGRASVTGNPADHGRFRTPTLRNIGFTGPYMHDGRFTTLEEVVEHYATGIRYTTTVDPLLLRGNLTLTGPEKSDLIAFLNALNDTAFVRDAAFSDPW